MEALIENLRSSTFWEDTGSTLGKAALAFALGFGIGVPLGLLLGRINWLSDAFELPVDFARSIPVSALFPAFVLWLGIGSGSQVAAAAFGCAMIFVINIIYGVRACRPQREAYLKTLGAGPWIVFTKVIAWEMSSPLLSAARLSLSNSLVLIVVTEMLGGGVGGLGQRIQDSRFAYRVPDMWVAIVVIGVIGLLLNRIITFLERRFIHWQGM
ncbi:MAG: ABC transporter permease subunit [Patescibacteria group bacterium]